MGRNKIHIKISPTIRNFLQYFADNQETISALYDLYKSPESGEVTESMYDMAQTVCDYLCKELNIKGKIDDQVLMCDYEYFEDNKLINENLKNPEIIKIIKKYNKNKNK